MYAFIIPDTSTLIRLLSNQPHVTLFIKLIKALRLIFITLVFLLTVAEEVKVLATQGARATLESRIHKCVLEASYLFSFVDIFIASLY